MFELVVESQREVFEGMERGVEPVYHKTSMLLQEDRLLRNHIDDS